MSSRLDEINPYASPAATAGEPGLVEGYAGMPITATLVRKDHLMRVLRLVGGVSAELEWNANWPTEFVRVDGHKVAKQQSLWYVPHFQFELRTPYGGVIPMTMDVQLTPWLPLFIRSLRLTASGRTIYRE